MIRFIFALLFVAGSAEVIERLFGEQLAWMYVLILVLGTAISRPQAIEQLAGLL